MNIIEITGYAASAFSILNQFPQAAKVFKTKDTHSISLTMYTMVVICISLWLVYGIMLNDGPLIVANAISLIPITYIFIIKLLNSIKGIDPWGI